LSIENSWHPCSLRLGGMSGQIKVIWPKSNQNQAESNQKSGSATCQWRLPHASGLAPYAFRTSLLSIAAYCYPLPLIASHCRLLPAIAAYCQPLPLIASLPAPKTFWPFPLKNLQFIGQICKKHFEKHAVYE